MYVFDDAVYISSAEIMTQ